MGSILSIIIIIGCIGLIFFVLIQNPKGGGLNSEFGSAVQLGGAKRATDILEKGTWGIAIGIALLCLVVAKDVQVVNTGEEAPELEADPDAVQPANDNSGETFQVPPGQVPPAGN